ncbi:hypothetical protein BDN67DRAFT_980458 [Paxillus ammoniavirescens]|nr:hypothetical protein BDN67DRAFT_980458 [Paxillus ammoniavirescens]
MGSTTDKFALAATLKNGHIDSIICLSFSRCGKYLASGGEDSALIIWDVMKTTIIHRLSTDSPVLSLQWDLRSGDPRLFYGCENGSLTLFSNIAHPGKLPIVKEVLTGVKLPVYCINMDSLSGARHGPGMRSSSGKGDCNSTIVDADKCIRARAIHFLKERCRVLVSYLNHGIIGSTALNPKETHILVVNLSTGLDLYPLGESAISNSIALDIPEDKNVPLSAIFISNGDKVTSGAADGKLIYPNGVYGVYGKVPSN